MKFTPSFCIFVHCKWCCSCCWWC